MELEKIKELVEDYYGLDLNIKSRKKIYVQARAIYYYIAREFTGNSLKSIGEIVGKDHATVLYFLSEITYMRKFDSNFNENFYELYEIAKDLQRVNKVELTLEQLVTRYNKLQIDYEVVKRRLNKYEPV